MMFKLEIAEIRVDYLKREALEKVQSLFPDAQNSSFRQRTLERSLSKKQVGTRLSNKTKKRGTALLMTRERTSLRKRGENFDFAAAGWLEKQNLLQMLRVCDVAQVAARLRILLEEISSQMRK